MGTYAYTFRKASRNIIDNGEKSKVQHLAFSYKPYYSWEPPAFYNRFVAVAESHAERSFKDYDGGYIVMRDVKDDTGKVSDLHNANVYKNLQTPIWYDHSEIPAEYVGYLVKEGRSYKLIHTVDLYEDDRAKVVSEVYSNGSLRYHFTNKITGKTNIQYMNEEEVKYATSNGEVARTVFSMVI
jgi:hypothetical protein